LTWDNRVEIAGCLVELGALRFTPAGIPAIEFRLRHESEQAEAQAKRQVRVELEAVAFRGEARLIAGAALGSLLRARGFLCARSRRSKKAVLHVTHIAFIEGA
jgi:primosomal replication protein N